jgi:hypothetical protein
MKTRLTGTRKCCVACAAYAARWRVEMRPWGRIAAGEAAHGARSGGRSCQQSREVAAERSGPCREILAVTGLSVPSESVPAILNGFASALSAG